MGVPDTAFVLGSDAVQVGDYIIMLVTEMISAIFIFESVGDGTAMGMDSGHCHPLSAVPWYCTALLCDAC